MGRATVDVIIPTCRPDSSFRDLMTQLSRQTYPAEHILIINTGEEDWDDHLIEGVERAEVFHITKNEFDHAATRNMGAGFSNADYLVFMTQDAVPADEMLIENLLAKFRDPLVKAVYARQLPKADCRVAEGYVRIYNYPEEGFVRRIEDVPAYGVKAYFCSNVCAAYEHRLFRELNGFSAPAIFNEDMIYAGRIMNLGYAVTYAADAQVYHSHNYSNLQQFRRNFDNGVSQAMHPELFGGIKSEGEGTRLVRFVSRALWEKGRLYLIPQFYIQCAFRLAGFRLGKRFKHLPMWMIRRCSMNRSFWTRAHMEALEE